MGRYELKLLLVVAALLALDQVVGELFELDLLVAQLHYAYWSKSINRKISIKVSIYFLYFGQLLMLNNTSTIMAVNCTTFTLPLYRVKPLAILSKVSGYNYLSS